MAFVRSFNPIWANFDLSGLIFDDSCYMYTLENTIPYVPQAVYHSPSGTEWTNPIQYLANGTLPVDIYWDPDKVYRLEFRRNDGTAPPSQNDALIYLVENYTPEGTGTNPSAVSVTTENQITNPQFALINFESPYEPSVTTTQSIDIGAGWVLELTGTGTILDLEQVAFNNSIVTSSNAPYALRINTTGWDAGGIYLRQRFEQNGLLWAGKNVATTITSRIEGVSSPVTASYWNSLGTEIAELLTFSPSSTFEEYANNETLDSPSSNTDTPPAAYTELRISVPNNSDIYFTSVQIVVSEGTQTLNFAYEEETINRQIDHTYNTAYPIMPVGAIIDYSGFGIPEHYFNCNGDAKNRITENLLFEALTTTESVTLTSGLNTFTVADSTDYWIGMSIEGTGLVNPTTITGISGTTITMADNATASGASTVRFFSTGAGNGSTTFNLPDLRDYVIAGVGGSLFGATNNGIGALGGDATVTIGTTNLPPHTHTTSSNAGTNVTGATNVMALAQTNTATYTGVATGNGPGASTPLSIVQQTALMRKIIRYE